MRRGYAVVVVLVMGAAACTPTEDTIESVTFPPDASTTTSLASTTSSTIAPDSVGPKLDLQYALRVGWQPIIRVRWHGLPEGVDHMTLVVAGRSDTLVRPVVAGEVSFRIGKPSWTKYATFTAYDAQGNEMLSEEVLLDGGSCSAKGALAPPRDTDLPDAVTDTRIYLAERAIRCSYAALAKAAADGGTFFDRPPDNLAADLKELDRRQGIMRSLLGALQEEPRAEIRDGQTVHVFTARDIEIVLDSEGRWITASS